MKHPSGKAHRGTLVIVCKIVKHYETNKDENVHLQANSVVLEHHLGALTISAIYCLPKHRNKKYHYIGFFNTLSKRFIAGGDYNAKHPLWGSRVETPIGKASSSNESQEYPTPLNRTTYKLAFGREKNT